MVTIEENKDLQLLNTFHIKASARYYTAIHSEAAFQELREHKLYQQQQRMILGGGSNVLFTTNFNGLIIKNNIPGKKLLTEDTEYYYVKAGAGETWHQFVLWCIQQGYAGLENLSLIPGCVGASPMQNIGAYGVEIKDVFHELEAIDLENGEQVTFSKEACSFGYRESVFKRQLKNRYLITAVTFRLYKKPRFNTSYGAIEKELESMGVKELSIKHISEAVIRIRSSKLPDPEKLGNAGSFFKNPEISLAQFEQLKQQYKDIVAYPLENKNMKLAAGWLIENCGWKGKTIGNTGVHVQQALVLVNYGEATGSEIYELSQQVLASVKDKFGVDLEREVNIIT